LDRDVLIRRLPVSGGETKDVVRLVGGHGTLGARPFAPDGRRFAYASFEPPLPTVRIVLFTPSDREPPENVPRRLTQIADAAKHFLVGEMSRHGYPPAVSRIFRRTPDGTVEFTLVKGNRPASDPYYTDPACDAEARNKAERQLRIEGEGHVWWTFLYVGERPTRLGNWRGFGNARDGGMAIVNYESLPGEVHPDQGLNLGFNAEVYLKGTIHKLGHALGLPHIGPDIALGLGNSLMGPNNSVYAERKHPHPNGVYLTEAEAAMLWEHPVFSGSTKDRQRQPSVRLVDYKPSYQGRSKQIILAGKLHSDVSAHSIVVHDDLGKPEDEY
jgi:hypothetical protein